MVFPTACDEMESKWEKWVNDNAVCQHRCQSTDTARKGLELELEWREQRGVSHQTDARTRNVVGSEGLEGLEGLKVLLKTKLGAISGAEKVPEVEEVEVLRLVTWVNHKHRFWCPLTRWRSHLRPNPYEQVSLKVTPALEAVQTLEVVEQEAG